MARGSPPTPRPRAGSFDNGGHAGALAAGDVRAHTPQTTEKVRRINLAAAQAVGNSVVFNDEPYY